MRSDYSFYVQLSDGAVAMGDEDRDPIAERIRSYRELPAGWNYGRGVAATAKAVAAALRLHRHGVGLGLETAAFPEETGGVVLAFYSGEDTLEVVVTADGAYDVRRERGAGTDFEVAFDLEEVSAQEVVGIITRFSGLPKWLSFGSLTPTSWTRVASVRQARPSGTQRPGTRTLPMAVGGSQYSMLNVLAMDHPKRKLASAGT